jgi:plastocyanin domain-containing protein
MRRVPLAILLVALTFLVAPGCGRKPYEVAIAVTRAGFVPKRADVPRGRDVTIIFTRDVEQTCAIDVVFPTLRRGFDLPLRVPVRVRLTAADVRDTLAFSCSTKQTSGMLVAR